MLRYFRLMVALFRYSLVRELMFKTNFILWIVVDIAWFFMQLVLVDVIYSHVNGVAGWSKHEMYLLVGTSNLIQQIFQFFFMVNCMELPENIRTGKLDFSMLQPANTQFLVSVRKFDPGALVNATVAVGLILYSVNKLNLAIQPLSLVLFLALIVNGVMIHYGIMMLMVTVSFWMVRAQGVVYGYYNLFQIARIPREAFKGVSKLLFTYCLPMLLVANFPASVMARGMMDGRILYAFVLTGFLLWMAASWFRYALKSYTSASS